MDSKQIVESILKSADIKINGDRPWDIKVKDERLYDRVLSKGTLGLGEAYMDGWWDCEDLDEMVCRALRHSDRSSLYKNLTTVLHYIKWRLFNLQTKEGSKKVAEEHYDLGNDLYESFLDKNFQYSCAYFKNTDSLDVAQEQKMDLICRKLNLKKGDKVLDIGCGWGGLAKYIAQKYGCDVTGITLSVEQANYAKEFTKGLSVKIKIADYRDIEGTFDKIISVGMFEHVGSKNYRKMFDEVKKHLKDDGLFLLHTIGKNITTTSVDQWIEKYIFPNSMIPSQKQITASYEGVFIMEDWHNFGPYYDKTLLAWFKNFDNAWPKLEAKYGKRFYRMWKFYLLSCAGCFRARDIHLWQIVLSPNGIVGGYESVR